MSPAAALQETYSYGIPENKPKDIFSNPLLNNKLFTRLNVKISNGQDTRTVNIAAVFNHPDSTTITSRKVDSDAIKTLTKKVYSFCELKENWDGYNGVTPEPAAIIDAIKLIKILPESALPDRAGISGDGEIGLFWDKKELYANFGVDGDGTFTYFIRKNNKKYYGDDICLKDAYHKK
jgi:hypothetical protein